ncbi:MAG: ABC transporter ATP-binding protein [Betaproteobacteria bacterium]|nr:ABC transporter ATP-binding protein [Betaproteobacteria bacterium]
MLTFPDLAIDLDVRGVSKHYRQHGKDFTAVDDLSLRVPKGAFCSILGPSGCGKTTLLRMIAGFIEPDAGEIFIGGNSMRGVPPNRRPANMIFQHLALFPMMSVGENVAYGLARRGIAKKLIQHQVDAMLERVGLAGAAVKRIDQLSGGQKQRAAIARSLVLEPTLLLLDEPLGALDLKLREHMKLELKQLQAQIGTTFVYITHDQSEALVMSDFIAVMNQGKFEQTGTPQDLYYRPQTAFVAGFVGNSNRLSGRMGAGAGSVAQVDDGPALFVSPQQAFPPGRSLALFIRPEAIVLACPPAPLENFANRLSGKVLSLFFDGANSTVLIRLDDSDIELHVALFQNGFHADIHPGDTVSLGIAAEHVLAFAV